MSSTLLAIASRKGYLALSTARTTSFVPSRHLKSQRTVSLESIKALRERTGAPIKAVKEALELHEGDGDQAVAHLRKLGASLAAHRSNRVAREGVIALAMSPANATETGGAKGEDGSNRSGDYAREDGTMSMVRRMGAMVELSSETDFVARTNRFTSLASTLASAALQIGQQGANNGAGDTGAVRTVSVDDVLSIDNGADQLADATAALGEKIELRRASILHGSCVCGYMHGTSAGITTKCGKIGVLVSLSSPTTDAFHPDMLAASVAGERIAMHIAAATPLYARMADVSAEAVQKERDILLEMAREEGKARGGRPMTDEVVARMVEGRLRKWYADVVLEQQEMVAEIGSSGGGKTRSVSKWLQDQAPGSSIVEFVRFQVGTS